MLVKCSAIYTGSFISVKKVFSFNLLFVYLRTVEAQLNWNDF